MVLEMRKVLIPFVLMALACAACFAGESDMPEEQDPSIWIRKLDSDDFDVRQDAVRILKAMGEKARKALSQALPGTRSLEARRKIDYLLTELNRASILIEAVDSRGQPISGVSAGIRLTPLTPTARSLAQTRSFRNLHRKTDKQGRFHIRGLWPGIVFRLSFDWEGWHALPPLDRSVALCMRGGTNRLRLVLSTGGSVRGRVVAEGAGGPLPGASVSVIRLGKELKPRMLGRPVRNLLPAVPPALNVRPAPSVKADAQGRFHLKGIPPGRYRVVASKPEFLKAQSKPILVTREKTVEVHPVLALIKRPKGLGAVKIKLTDAKGRPLSEETLQVIVKRTPVTPADKTALRALIQRFHILEQSAQKKRTIKTNSKGELLIPDLPPGRTWLEMRTTAVGPNAGALAFVEGVAVKAGTVTDLGTRTIGRVAGFAGRLVDEQGRTINRAGRGWRVYLLPEGDPEVTEALADPSAAWHWVRMRAWRQARNARGMLYVGTRGHFQSAMLAPGRYAVGVEFRGRPEKIVRGVVLEGGRTNRIPDISVRVPKAGKSKGRVHGEVLYPNGFAVKTGMLMVRYVDGGTNCRSVQGRFTVYSHPLFGAPVELTFLAVGCRPCRMVLSEEASGVRSVEMRVRRAVYGRARVTVLDAKGRPLPRALVAVRPDGLLSLSSPTRLPVPPVKARSTNQEGVALIKGLACGQRSFDATVDGYYLLKPVEAELRGDREVEVRIRMLPGRALRGRLIAPNGYDFGGSQVHMQRTHWLGPVLQTADVSADGRFSFSGIAPGWVKLAPQCPGLIPETSGLLQVSPAKDAEFRMKLVRPRRLRLALGRDRVGAEVEICEVKEWHPAYRDRFGVRKRHRAVAMADADGRVEFQGLPPRCFDVLVRSNAEARIPGLAGRVIPAAALHTDIVAPSDSGRSVAASLKLPSSQEEGRISGRLSFKRLPAALRPGDRRVRLYLTLVGRRSVGQCAIPLSGPRPSQAISTVHLSRKPLPDFSATEDARFTFTGLTPGEYRLLGELRIERTAVSGPVSLGDVKVFRSVTLGRNEFTLVGEIIYEPPPELAEYLRKTERETFDQLFGRGLGPDKE